MKHMTRLALAFAIATIACLAPVAHADDPEALLGSGATPLLLPVNERHYDYYDADGFGTMTVQDGPTYAWGRPIYVTIHQNGYTFYGSGSRKYASSGTGWLAYCEFWVYGYGLSVKFKGYIPIFAGYSPGWGSYFYNGVGSPHWWQVIY